MTKQLKIDKIIPPKYQLQVRIFLLVDLLEMFFSDLGSGDCKKKDSENDQLTGQSLLPVSL